MRKLSVGLIMIVLIMASNPSAIQTDTHTDFEPIMEESDLNPILTKDFPFEFDEVNESAMNINIVMLGFNQSIVDETYLRNQLIDWHAPIDRYPEIYRGDPTDGINFDVNYTITYDIQYLTNQDVLDYKNFITTNGTEGEAYYDWSLKYLNGETSTLIDTAKYVRSENAEDYLQSNYGNEGEHTIVLINTYTGYEDNFMPYYYNSSYTEMDNTGFVGRRYSSTNQIAGGGADSRLLFVDYSAGPEGYNRYYEKQAHILDFDLSDTVQIDLLVDEMAIDINSAIEFRMLPSYIYEPIVPQEEVKFEFLILNFEDAAAIPQLSEIPTTGFDFASQLQPEKVVQDFVEVNPNVEWTYEMKGELDWYNIPGMNASMVNAINTTDHTIASGPLISIFDQIYQDLFTQSNETLTVVPAFIWGLPGDYSTDFGGVAHGDQNGDFLYFISARSYNFAAGVEYSSPWIDTQNNTLIPGQSTSYGYFEGYFEGETYQTELNISEGDSVKLEIMTYADYMRKLSGEPYDTMVSVDGLTSSSTLHKFNVTGGDIFNVYYWYIENTGTLNTTYFFDITAFRTLEYGFSRVSIHEGGHGIGVSHPHDGFSWAKYNAGEGYYGEYQNWLWDQSYTTMSYAASIPGLSPMDIDSVQRGFLFDYFNQLNDTHSEIMLQIFETGHKYLPDELTQSLTNAIGIYQDAVSAFNALDYRTAVEKSMNAFALYDELLLQLDISKVTTKVIITGLENIDPGITYEVNVGENIDGTTGETSLNTEITMTEEFRTDLIVEIFYEGVLLYKYTGYSWETVNIDLSGISLSTDNHQEDTSTNPDDSSEPPVSESTLPTTETTPGLNISFNYGFMLISIISIGVIVRNRRYLS